MSDQETTVKSIPANIEAERAVLGALLIDPDAIIKVASYLRSEDFYRERHSWIYEAIFQLNERREPLDTVTLIDELERRGQLEEIGGPAYIVDLINSTPTAIYVDHYARIVERTATLRRLISAAGRIAELAYEEDQDVEGVMDRAEQIIFGVSESRIHRDLTPIRQVMGNVIERIDELARNPDRLMGVPTGFTMLDRLLGGLQKSDLIILAGRPGMGKCVAADTTLVNPKTGELQTIEAMVKQQRGDLLTLAADYKLHPTQASDFVDDGFKPTYRVTTGLGREIKVTLTHPFLTINGWRPLAELAVGDSVAVPRHIPVFGSDATHMYEAILLGYLLADGCLTGTSPQFTHINPTLRADFTQAALHFPGVKARTESSKGTRTPTVYITNDLQVIRQGRHQFATNLQTLLHHSGLSPNRFAKEVGVSPSLVYQWGAGKIAPSLVAFRTIARTLGIDETALVSEGLASISKNGNNTLTQWLVEQEVWGKAAAEKFIPTAVYRYHRQKLALFLNRLFACDGSVYLQNGSQPTISYSTVSKQLASGVQHLLLRFGILAKLCTRPIKYGGERRRAYELRITHAASLHTFSSEIGAFGKEDAIATILNKLAQQQSNLNLDVVPQAIWQQIEALKGDRSWRSLHTAMGLPEGTNLHGGKRSPSRKRLAQIAEALGSQELRDLAHSDLYWDKVVAIEPLGEQQVYDLTVPETHNFVANDMLVHNTSFALSIAQNAAKRYDARVAVFSLEMSSEQLVQRLLSMETAIDSHRLRLGAVEEDEWPILLEAANSLSNTKIFIDDTPAASITDIRTKSRRLYAEHGLDMILIDYMQLMTGPGGGGRNDNRQQEISFISRSLKALARELNVPVIALSQLSRAVEGRSDKKPMLSDLRESGCLTGDTLVRLAHDHSLVPIQSLINKTDTKVISLNLSTGMLEPAAVTNAFCTGTKPTYLLRTRRDNKIRATSNHRFLTDSGWKRLDQIEVNEKIAVPQWEEQNLLWDSVASIESAGVEPVYDLTVPEHHNFVAGNLIVHNSIEQDADLVMFIYREDYYQEDSDKQNIADVLVAKHRHGSTGTVSLYFRKELTQFRDLEIQRTELEY